MKSRSGTSQRRKMTKGKENRNKVSSSSYHPKTGNDLEQFLENFNELKLEEVEMTEKLAYIHLCMTDD